MIGLLALLPGALAAPDPLLVPVHTSVRHPDDYAVVIGIEDYAFLPDVPHAEADAAAVQTWLVATRGVPDHRVEWLRGASREQILAALDRASAAVGPSGTLWVYWAGHGAASATTGERLLLGVDVMADPSVFEARAVPVAEVEDRLGKAPHGVLWADTCYAGVGRDGAPLLPGTRFAVPTYAAAKPAGDVLRWTAAGPGELSQAHPSGHGAFTWATLRAVRGEADGALGEPPDGTVDAGEAQAFTVRTLAAAGIRGQSPQLEGDATFALVDGLPEAAPPPPVASEPAPRPTPAPAPARPGRQRATLLLAAGAGIGIGTALATKAAYTSAAPSAGSLDGLVTANHVAGGLGLAAAVGAAGLGVTLVLP